MAFWGAEVKPGKPITHSCEKARGRLRISQATLGIGDASKNSVVQCNVGNRSPVLICALLPSRTESCHLDLEFEEADDVVFSVIGPRSVYLTGYYVRQSQQSNPHSDSESYGVDIENTQTEESSYGSDDDKYEDSFIDDGGIQVSSPSPVLSSKENDKPKDIKGRGKRLKKKYQVVESDNDANSHESEEEDEDDYLLSVFKSKRAAKTTLTDDGEKIAQAAVEMADKSKDDGICGRKSKEKVDSADIKGKPERETKLPFNDKGTQVKDEIPKEVETLEEIMVNNKVLTDDKVHGNKVEANIINQNPPISNGNDQTQSLDFAKPKKKRKDRSKEEKTCEVEMDKDHSVLREDKEHGVEASTDMEVGANSLAPSPELGSEKGKKSKKRRKDLQLEEACTEGIGVKCHNKSKEDKFEQGLLRADSMTKDLPAANGEYEEQQIDNNVSIKSELLANDSQPDKKMKKKMKKKTQGEGDLKMGLPSMTDNQENTFMKYEDQTTNAEPTQKRTLSNGLIIEEVAKGSRDGKVAAPGKKVKIYYTAMLKENGHIFDSNVGKTACKFRLGDEKFIDGWNVGIDGMHVGDKRRLTIPPSMGFGKHGAAENVPPNSWLVYDVELVGVRK